MAFPSHGVKNTLRFCQKNTAVPLMERKKFGKEVLIQFFGLKVDDVFCLQDNSVERYYDVTFCEQAVMLGVKEKLKESRDMQPVADFRVENLHLMNYRLVMVHMYNPHVPEEDIKNFLRRYGKLPLDAPKKLKDDTGFWTGKRTFDVFLKKDEKGFDGLAHPPALFAIGGDRGYLQYYRQPPFCRKCRGNGHKEDNCGDGVERPRPKACHTCGSEGHLYRDCPGRGGAGGGRPGGGESGTVTAGPSSPAGEGGQKRQGEKDSADAASGTGGRTEGKKVRKDGGSGEEMDTGGIGEEMTGGGAGRAGGEAGVVLSFASGRPANLFGPPSPASTEGTATWAERVGEGGQEG